MRLMLIALLAVPSLLAGQFTTTNQRRSLTAFRSEKELSAYLERMVRQREQARIAAERARCAPMKVSRKRIKAAAGPRYAVVDGRVTEFDGKTPVAGAQVIWGRNSVPSDANGRFRIVARDVATRESTQVLRVRAIGFHSMTENLRLAAGDSVVIQAALCPTQLSLSEVVVTGAAPGQPSVTNVQEAGVGEGGLVKLAGDYLVILRRGRLFTVAVGGGALRPVAAVNAFPPDLERDNAWYDELLVYRDRVVVIGYSYPRGGAEVGLFRLDSAGGIRYEATYNFRSNDYYSSRNYASRLIGSTLVLYSPLYLGDPKTSMPAMRRWQPRGDSALQPMARAHRVYRPPHDFTRDYPTLHALTTCDLAQPELRCAATVVIGSWARVTYSSPTAMYIWTASQGKGGDVLYRLPFDGGAPTALRVSGMPIDQFSFREDPDGRLNVFVVDRGHGERMWRAESSEGKAALARLDLDRFGDGTRAAPRGAYRFVATATNSSLQNRFVGDWLLFGRGDGWGWQQSTGDTLRIVPLDGGAVTTMALPHGVDRIEAMGSDAVVIGTGSGNLHFTGIDLAREPGVAQQLVIPGAAQGELRSHGFFYREEGLAAGTIGLPIREANRPGFSHLREGSASIVFVRNAGSTLTQLGNLMPVAPRDTADGCVASCVDWYGNARPIFLGDRVLALLGYEVVEGAVRGGKIVEVGRAMLLK
jgi:hypothetical protein